MTILYYLDLHIGETNQLPHTGSHIEIILLSEVESFHLSDEPDQVGRMADGGGFRI